MLRTSCRRCATGFQTLVLFFTAAVLLIKTVHGQVGFKRLYCGKLDCAEREICKNRPSTIPAWPGRICTCNEKAAYHNVILCHSDSTVLPDDAFVNITVSGNVNIGMPKLKEMSAGQFDGFVLEGWLRLGKRYDSSQSSSTTALVELPAGLFKGASIQALDIDLPGVKHLPPRLFEGRTIEQLYLKFPAVEHLPPQLFRGMKTYEYKSGGKSAFRHLYIFYAFFNGAATVPEGFFDGLIVHEMHLTMNSLLVLPSNVYRGFQVNSEFSLSSSDSMTTIEAGALNGLKTPRFNFWNSPSKLVTVEKFTLQNASVGLSMMGAPGVFKFQVVGACSASAGCQRRDPTALDCCGLEWLWNGDMPFTLDPTARLTCNTPSSLKGVDVNKKTDLWDPASVKDGSARFCSCNDPKQLLQGANADGNPNCVDACGAGHVQRGGEGDENDVCDRCRLHKDSAKPFALDEHCTTCKVGNTVGFPDTCTKCTDNYYLKANQGCVKDCGLDVKGNVHLHFRNVGSDKDGRTCQACEDTKYCNKCPNDANICTECTIDYHLHNGVCVEECPSQLKPKSCNNPTDLRDKSNKDEDYLWRFVPTGGNRSASNNLLTGSVCKESVAEDAVKPSPSLQLSPNFTHTRDSSLLLTVAFEDQQSDIVTGLAPDFSDIAFTPEGRAQPADNVGRIFAKGAFLQVNFNPSQQGKVTINLPANVSADESCNTNTAATPISIVYDTDQPTIEIASFSNNGGLEDTIEIKIVDALSPIVLDAAELYTFVKLHPLGRDDVVPTISVGSTPCKLNATTATCTFTAKHPADQSIPVPYRFQLNPKAAADAAGNESPLLVSEPFHCRGVKLGVNGKCIQFHVGVNKAKIGARTRYGSEFTDPDTTLEYIVGESYRIAPRTLIADETTVSAGFFENITYALADAPDGWFVGTDTGQITGVFDLVADGGAVIKMKLNAVDEGGATALVEVYTFAVVNPPQFELAKGTKRTRSNALFTDPVDMLGKPYIVGRNYRIAPIELIESKTNVSAGDFDNITYTVEGAPDGWFVGADTGEISGTFGGESQTKIHLYAVDFGNQRTLVETYNFTVENPAAFAVAVDKSGHRKNGSKYDDPPGPNKVFITGKSYRIAPQKLMKSETTVSAGYFENITYALAGAPDGWFVGTKSGEITGVFGPIDGNGYEIVKMTLVAVDHGKQTDPVEIYTFNVTNPAAFDLVRGADRQRTDPSYIDPKAMNGIDRFYAVNSTYQIAPLAILETTTFSTPGGASSLRYALNGTLPGGLFVKTTTGDIQVSFAPNDIGKNYSVDLDVVDGSERHTLETIPMWAKYRDIDDPDNVAEFGPNKTACAHGVPFDDGNEFDGRYACDCSGTLFEGSNCQVPMQQVLNCEDGSSLVDGECAFFDLKIDKQTRAKNAGTSDYTDPIAMRDTFYEVGVSYRVAPFEILSTTVQSDSTGDLADITYTLSVGAPDSFFLSTTSGELFWRFGPQDSGAEYNITLFAVDKAGARQEVETMRMRALFNDLDVPSYGPNNQGCKNGAPIDGDTFDQSFTCDCGNTSFAGETCSEIGPHEQECFNDGKVVDVIPFDGVYTCDCEGTGFLGDNCGKSRADAMMAERAEKGKKLIAVVVSSGSVLIFILGAVVYVCCKKRIAKKDALLALDTARTAYGLAPARQSQAPNRTVESVTNPAFVGITLADGAAIGEASAALNTTDAEYGYFTAAVQAAAGVSTAPAPPPVPGTNSKFVAPTINLGDSLLAAKGLDVLLGIDPKTYMHARNKVKVIISEFAKRGTDEDRQNIAGLLDGTYVNPPDSGSGKVYSRERSCKEVMATSPEVEMAGLELHHLLALRLYTTSTYKSINNPMRQTPPELPHPFAATMYYISDALSKLREVQGKDPKMRNTQLVFWRGMQNLQMTEEFARTGGTEMACMSTTSSMDVAAEFAESESPLLFKFVSNSFMSHGADISFLSVYPGEKEVLYPPLTYLRPIRMSKKRIGGRVYDVVEVEPVFPK